MKTQGGFLMTQIKQLGARIFEQMLAEQGISEFNGAQGKILYILWENQEITITRISKLTSLAKTTLTSMLDRMEEAGLVIRRPNPDNRREILVSITPKAKQLREDYDTVSDRINEVYYKDFGEEEVRNLEQYLFRILANLEMYEEQKRRKQ